MSLEEAARSGDRRRTLEVLRDRIARTIDGTESAREIGTLAGRLMDTLGELAVLGVKDGKPTPLDEMAARRAKRIAEREAASTCGGSDSETRAGRGFPLV